MKLLQDAPEALGLCGMVFVCLWGSGLGFQGARVYGGRVGI